MSSVLFVDDEPSLRRAVQRWLDRHGITVHTARSVKRAKDCFAEHPIDGAFIDVWLGDGTGYELYDWIRANRPDVADYVVFLTGDIVPNPIADERLQASGRPLLTKPFDLVDLERYVRQWAARRRDRDAGSEARSDARRAEQGALDAGRDATGSA